MISGTLCFTDNARSASRRGLLLCTIKLTPKGAVGRPVSRSMRSSRSRVSTSQASYASLVRQFSAGNVPMIPARQHSTTRSGLETRNIGAATAGIERRPLNSTGIGKAKLPVWLILDDRDRARPSGGRFLDLDRKARDLEAVVGQGVEVRQLFHVAITDLTAGLVTFPDDAGVPGLLVSLRRVVERRVPAPRVCAGDANALLQEK